MAEERCEWSDFLVSNCQHCKDGKKITGKASKAKLQYGDGEDRDYSGGFVGASRVFPARYPGVCGGCKSPIDLDEDIYMENGSAHHAHC